LLGRVADAGDSTEFSGWRLHVVHMTGRRINRIRAEPMDDSATAETAPNDPPIKPQP